MLIRSMLIGVFCYLGALSVPWAGGLTGGWYTLSRPLVSGMIVGTILGDIQQGIIIGVAVQAVYIAMITPGGTMPADLNFVAYPAIALGILSGSDPKVAVTLASTIGILGTIIHNFTMVTNSAFNHMGDKAVEAGDLKGIVRANAVYPQILTFLVRFIPTVIAVHFGAPYIDSIMNSLPQTVIDAMAVLGGMLPALGVGILLTQIIKDYSLFVFFLVGYIAIVFLQLNMIALAIVGACLALIHFKYSSTADTNEEAIL
ncbi:PTS mannose/fructose/sorbose/N-acetylgalactosamine transporter subunit IIC [Halanaerobium salsuginis]|uniref:PTS system, mannose-specific IIC component n=1 Tax=Halanaerobium salsuginis TaxID=29563 RepID=A0A1I4J989_9FIRM|nr:PTS sugar transporter subunit IIC [Halanaerobium salsuginis]SFL63129.1 PTS system, mannose-specific IIC component [Halanaerobium salsuginis]